MSPDADRFPGWLTFLLALTCGLGAANIYYAQPLVGVIGTALDMPDALAGLIVSVFQIGYGVGLFFVVPVADLVENRRLVIGLLGLSILSLIGAALSTTAAAFLLSAWLIGIASVAVQVIVPYTAHLAPARRQGQVVGNIMSGLMLGIMLSRPAASFATELFSWHAIFIISAGLLTILVVVLALVLPPRRPQTRMRYRDLIASMAGLALRTPTLQRRACYQACMFGSFTLFWTTAPLLLTEMFHLSQGGIALFALAGVAGAIAAPIAGRVADRGWIRSATVVAAGTGALACLLALVAANGTTSGLALLVLAAILLDAGATGVMVLGQRSVFSLAPELRGRLNGLYMTAFFLSGALFAAIGGGAYAMGGWTLAMAIGGALPLVALSVLVATEILPARRAAAASAEADTRSLG
ncbi:MFS transporter [Amorphus orientalis]